MEKAYKQEHEDLVEIQMYPQYDVLRSDARFQDLLRRMKFPNQPR